MLKPLVTSLAAAVLFIFSVQTGWSQSDCDPALRGDADHPQGYRQRGDRCEGLYWRPHAMEGGLSVAGFRRIVPAAWSTLPNSLRFGWNRKPPIPPNANILIKAVSLRSDMYYRMDTNKTYSLGACEWPTDVLSALHLEFKDLGVFAFTSTKIGGVMWQVYFPLDVGPSGAKSSAYEVTLVPGTALVDLSWQCLRIGADGIPVTRLAGEKLRQQFPAGDPIRLNIALPQYDGFSYLEVSANALSPNVTEPLYADFAFLASH